MRDLKTLVIQPKEYFKDFKQDEYESKEPIKLKYLFIALIAISILTAILQNIMVPNLMEDVGLEGTEKTTFMVFQVIGCIVGPLIWAWICVNILYLVNKGFMGVVEKNEIKDKKYFKSLLYFRFIVFLIASSILSIITTLILRDIQAVTIANSINNIFVKLWATYFLYGILKYYLQTKKIHKILPTILYIFTLIGAIGTIASTMFSNSMPI